MAAAECAQNGVASPTPPPNMIRGGSRGYGATRGWRPVEATAAAAAAGCDRNHIEAGRSGHGLRPLRRPGCWGRPSATPSGKATTTPAPKAAAAAGAAVAADSRMAGV